MSNDYDFMDDMNRIGYILEDGRDKFRDLEDTLNQLYIRMIKLSTFNDINFSDTSQVFNDLGDTLESIRGNLSHESDVLKGLLRQFETYDK